MADGEAPGGVVAGDGELDDDAQAGPLDRASAAGTRTSGCPARGWSKRRRRVSKRATSCSGHHVRNSALTARQAVDELDHRRVVAHGGRGGAELGERLAGVDVPVDDQPAHAVVGEQHPDQVALDALEPLERRVQAGLGGVPGRELPVRPEHVRRRRLERRRSAGAAPTAPRRASSTSGPFAATGWASDTRCSWPASSRRRARPIERSTSVDALIRRPCSSHVYQVTETPASRATSSRRRPGVRRLRPRGSLTCSGVSASRRARRNAAELGALLLVGHRRQSITRRTYQRTPIGLPTRDGLHRRRIGRVRARAAP